jgi:hypothetical protein
VIALGLSNAANPVVLLEFQVARAPMTSLQSPASCRRPRKKKATAEAIVAYVKDHMPELEACTLEFVEDAFRRLPRR